MLNISEHLLMILYFVTKTNICFRVLVYLNVTDVIFLDVSFLE